MQMNPLVTDLHVDNVQEEAKTPILMKLTICGLVDTVSKDRNCLTLPVLTRKSSRQNGPSRLSKKTTYSPASRESRLLSSGWKETCVQELLKDEENKPLTLEKRVEKLVSECGNARLFDPWWVVISTLLLFIVCVSFRCSFFGKPAFKPGMEKVLLNLNNSGRHRNESSPKRKAWAKNKLKSWGRLITCTTFD
ncbi:hypothetical protein PsorP6_002632 [Peronosclerospora sorghi]|uniref:Uncharacterized protein n=1 Tax=Peronosclerospora sorghi TaxID=230839 RepID=A0ACC0WQ28_9STRA|nr:hypothetical protein PsorP6_002632 [Peronosclerospora sorghi]